MTNFVSLFSGGGGLDIGFEQAGFDCVYAGDLDPMSIETLQLNRGKPLAKGRVALQNAVIAQSDIRDLTAGQILSETGWTKSDVPLLIGGPPCQSWSSAGKQKGFADPRGELMTDYIRLAVELGVRWVVLENVRGLVTARGHDGIPGSALARIRELFFSSGFQTTVQLLNSADYGVPQRRVRLFMIAYRSGDPPRWPAPTHAKTPDLTCGRAWVTMRECFERLEPVSPDEIIRPSPHLKDQLLKLRPGHGVKSPGKPETTRPSGHWGYKQGAFLADLDAPARTVTASAQQDWIDDPRHGLRRLTTRECAALQTFPVDWEFSGKRIDRYRLIGNAVPPLVASCIANELLPVLSDVNSTRDRSAKLQALEPLPWSLLSAIDYTKRDERRNGESRRRAKTRLLPVA
jgi:DNA (cytosine-5)-methyltransferase 1